MSNIAMLPRVLTHVHPATAAAPKGNAQLRLDLSGGWFGETDADSRGALHHANLPVANLGVFLGNQPPHDKPSFDLLAGLLFSAGATGTLATYGVRAAVGGTWDVPLSPDVAFRADVAGTLGLNYTTEGARSRISITPGVLARVGLRLGPVTPYLQFALSGGLGISPNDVGASQLLWSGAPAQILNGVGQASATVGLEVPINL